MLLVIVLAAHARINLTDVCRSEAVFEGRTMATKTALRLGSPIRANFEITDACPLACEHCYTYWGFSATGSRHSRDRSGRSLEDLKAVLDIIISSGIQVVTFTGGEPLVRKDLLFPLIAQAKVARLRVLVNTSASMLTARDADHLADLEVDGFLVSLMSGFEDENNAIAHANSFARTSRGIKMLADRGLAVTVNMVCSKKNFASVRRTARLAFDLGATMFSATPMLPTIGNTMARDLHLSAHELRAVMMDLAWVRDTLPMRVTTLDPVAHCQFDADERHRLGGLLGERYCCAGITDCAISADGDLRACIMTDQVGGNIVRDGWQKAWNSLASWCSDQMLPIDCLGCSLVDSCGGGCRVAAQATTGFLNGKDPYMTAPIVGVCTPERNRAPLLSPGPDTMLEFHPEMITRPEPFGGTLFLRGKATFLKTTPFQLVVSQKELGPFAAKDWAEGNRVEMESILAFLSVLLADDFLRIWGGGEIK